ncbi:sensor histidine kinase [Cohnella terricola]|uniref:Sensor histidine kinase n=1 Tax=Cohnella terricola TaxID=1289167 RepID=A0A559JTW8_9BACL|nr:sensor histidine kinase [Cohnella terricola]TVY03319.1 sensor histidine kinase [Cohnella terricola]
MFFGSFAGFIIVVLVVVIGVNYRFSVREMVNSTAFYQQNNLNQLDKQLNIQMTEIENISLAISRNSNLQEYLNEAGADSYTRFTNASRLTIDLSNIAFSMPIIQSIRVYVDDPPVSDYQGPVTYVELRNLLEEQWSETVENSDFSWIGQHVISTNKGDLPVISFARKIYTPGYEYKALVVLDIKASDIIKLIQGEEPDSNRVLLDLGLRAVTSTGDIPAEQYRDTVQDLIHNYNVNINDKGNIRYHDSLVVWSKLFSSDWILMEVTPWSEITKGSVRTAEVLFSIGVVAVVIALIMTLIISKQFTKPIILLLKRMNSFSLGNKDKPMINDYHNEFGALFNGYSVLVDRTTELYASLKQQYRKQKEAEIQALQAMINPHFLYNTLDQLNWMAIEAGEERMSRVLELMGRMFRIGLSNGESIITVEKELTHLECYLQIQQIRWGEKLSYVIEVPEAIKALYIPKLTLQPFVENAIIHGFHGRDTGLIVITAVLSHEDVEFKISDNGVGIPANWKRQKTRNTGGYGIRNVRERMIAYYGPAYDIGISSNPNTGTLVSIRIPEMREKPASKGG